MERKKLEKEQNEQIAHINKQAVPQNNVSLEPTKEVNTSNPTTTEDIIFESAINNNNTPSVQNEEVVESIFNIEVPNTDISVDNNIEQPVDDIKPINNKQFIIFTDPDQKEE